ncbi:MAG: hypothetical protein WC683_19220 [bacterium]
MAKTDFDTPVIFGALCDDGPTAPNGIERMIRLKKQGAVLLPFHVEARHLGNVLRCMQLMDVAGLLILGSHRKRVTRHLKSLHPSARAKGMVDVIIRKGRGFKGYCAEQIALSMTPSPSARKIADLTRKISVELLTGRFSSK